MDPRFEKCTCGHSRHMHVLGRWKLGEHTCNTQVGTRRAEGRNGFVSVWCHCKHFKRPKPASRIKS